MRSVICLALLTVIAYGCDIKVTLTSQTFHHRYAQFTFHNNTKSPVYEFDKDGQEKKLQIVGQMCAMKPTKLDIYKEVPKPGVKPCGSTSAFIEGLGMVNYVFVSDGAFMGAKIGVACAAGDCGNSRG